MTALTRDGELNTSFIQKELVDALEEDRTYHITDEAKKKHITTAGSYDEFRHLVACADLKRVTRKDMDSLGKPEKGWQTKGNLATGTGKGKRGRANGRKDSKGKVGAAQIEKAFPAAPPKNPMAFDRDWRRHCASRELKLRYLRLCGPGALQKVFKTEMDVALMGQIIRVFAETSSALAAGSGAAEAAAGEGPPVADDLGGAAREIFSYMRIFPETGRFGLNVEFLGDEDRANVRACLDWLTSVQERASGGGGGGDDAPADERTADFTPAALALLRTKFKV